MQREGGESREENREENREREERNREERGTERREQRRGKERMATEEIKITIAAKSYTLNIDSTKREQYRLAEKRVNASVTKFQKMNFDGFRLQDAIALTAFEFAVANINLKQQNELDPEDVTTLKELGNRIEEYLNRPSND